MKNSDRSIQLKCTAGVIAGCILLLLCVKYKNTMPQTDRSMGAETFLLIIKNDDIAYLRRWQKIHNPANIFGYNGKGVFSAALPDEKEVELPRIGRFTVETVNLFVPEKSRLEQSPLKIEMMSQPVKRFFASPRKFPEKQWNQKSLPVYDARSSIICEISGVPGSKAEKPLIIRSAAAAGGSDFAVIESSGDRTFDNAVIKQLAAVPDFRKGYSGVVAVWPELGNMVKK